MMCVENKRRQKDPASTKAFETGDKRNAPFPVHPPQNSPGNLAVRLPLIQLAVCQGYVATWRSDPQTASTEGWGLRLQEIRYVAIGLGWSSAKYGTGLAKKW
jgi:hypothetical protein